MNSRLKYTPKSISQLQKTSSERFTVSNLPQESFIKEKKTKEMNELKK